MLKCFAETKIQISRYGKKLSFKKIAIDKGNTRITKGQDLIDVAAIGAYNGAEV